MGAVLLWDGNSTWTEVFNVRRIKWYDTVSTKDADYFIGDQGGTERAQRSEERRVGKECRL